MITNGNRRPWHRQPRLMIPLLIAFLLVLGLASPLGSWLWNSNNNEQAPNALITQSSPNAGRTPMGIPPYGCKTNAQGQLDASDPLCDPTLSDHDRYTIMVYRSFAAEPAYDCPTNRTLSPKQAEDFRPCPNGAVHLVIDRGTVRIVAETGKAGLIHSVNVTNANAVLEPPSEGMYLWPYKQIRSVPNDSGQATQVTTWHLAYRYAPHIVPFRSFVRPDGESWRYAEQPNVDDEAFAADGRYEIVFTWTDPTADRKPAHVPFDWCKINRTDSFRPDLYC